MNNQTIGQRQESPLMQRLRTNRANNASGPKATRVVNTEIAQNLKTAGDNLQFTPVAKEVVKPPVAAQNTVPVSNADPVVAQPDTSTTKSSLSNVFSRNKGLELPERTDNKQIKPSGKKNNDGSFKMNWRVKLDNNGKAQFTKFVNKFMESNKEQPLTSQNLTQFFQTEVNSSFFKNEDLDSFSSFIHTPDLLADAMTIQKNILLESDSNPTESLQSDTTVKTKLHQFEGKALKTIVDSLLTKSNSQIEKTILRQMASNLSRTDTVKPSVYQKLETILAGDTEGLNNLIKIDKMYNRAENKTNMNDKQIKTAERELGIEILENELVQQYKGQDSSEKTYMQMGIEALFGNVPGGDNVAILEHMDESKAEEANLGTQKETVLSELPKFSVKLNSGGQLIHSLMGTTIKNSLQIVNSFASRALDTLSGVAVGGFRKVTGQANFVDTFRNKGAFRKSLTRSLLGGLSRLKSAVGLSKSFGLMTRTPEDKCFNNLNNLRNELSEAKDPADRTRILSEIKTEQKTLEAIIKDKEQSLTDAKSSITNYAEKLEERAESYIKNDMSYLAGNKDGEIKTISSTIYRNMEKSVTTLLQGASKQSKQLSRDIREFTTMANDLDKSESIQEQENELALLKDLNSQLETGVSKLETQQTVYIEDSVTSLLNNPPKVMSDELKQVLKDIKRDPEYFDTAYVSESVMNELDSLIQFGVTGNKSQSDQLKQVKSYVDNNTTLSLMRQKTDFVKQGTIASGVIEMGSHAVGGGVGGHAAKGVIRVLRTPIKSTLQSLVNTAYSAGNTRQYDINVKAGTVADLLQDAEDNILNDLESKGTLTANETLIKNFLTEKKEIDKLMLSDKTQDENQFEQDIYQGIKQNREKDKDPKVVVGIIKHVSS